MLKNRVMNIYDLNLDKSAASRELVATFVNSTYFDQVADLPANADLEGLTGNRVTDSALRASIALYDLNRRLVADLYAARSRTPSSPAT